MQYARGFMAVGIVLGFGAVAHAADSADQTTVPIEKVVLFSSGVGYFQHHGTVEGDATAELRFKTEQINDVLKSLVLEDLGGGQAGTVVYPSQDPLSRTLSSFQIDLSTDPTFGELLDQLRGARVTVDFKGEEIAGVILGLERKSRALEDGDFVEERWWLTILSEGTMRSIPLEDVRRIELEDQQLQAELNKALEALAQARNQDKKPVEINFTGQGQREVRMGYVVETPVWKTTYRLIMPEEKEAKGWLQGWAIVENQTESDWNDVQLSLVSGQPISFVQNLYQPLYVQRPVVQPERYASLMPQRYDAGVDMDAIEDMEVARGRGQLRAKAGGIAGNAARRIAGAPLEAPSMALADESYLYAAESVESAAVAGDVGELFQYTVSNVSLPRQRSAMIPIVTEEIDVERVSIYNQNVLAKHPLNGALLKNTTGNHLLQGPMTVLDDNSYAGDARIENLPPGQERLLSYAIDLNVHVNATNRRNDSDIVSGRISKGTLYVQRKQVYQQEYVLDNKGDKDRTIIIEHPFRQNWKLVDTPKPYETTDSLYRFKVQALAGKTVTFAVTEENVYSETIAILPADIGQLQYYARTGRISEKVRNVLAKAIEQKGAIVDLERQMQGHRQRISEITQEQSRIRENMKTVSDDSQYYARLLSKLDDQETEIEKLRSQIAELEQQFEQKRDQLEEYLVGMSVD